MDGGLETGTGAGTLRAPGCALLGNEHGAAGRDVPVARRRAAVDDDRRIAAGDDGRSAMSPARAGHLVADASDALAAGIGACSPADDGAAMIGGVAGYDEWSRHEFPFSIIVFTSIS